MPGRGRQSSHAFFAFVVSAAALYATRILRQAFDDSGNIRPFDHLTSGPDVISPHPRRYEKWFHILYVITFPYI